MNATPFTSTAVPPDTLTEIASGRLAPSSKRTATSFADKPGIFQRGSVYLIAAGHFVNDAYTGCLAPLLPLLMARLQFPVSRAGVLASVLSASTSLSQPIFGMLSDRFGKRYFVFLGPLITGIFICSLGYSNSYLMLIPLLMLSGLGSSVFHPTAAAMVSRVSGPRKEWGMSLFITSGNFGHAIAPLLVVPVVTSFGFEAMPLLILPAIGVAVLLFRQLPQNNSLPALPKDFLHHQQSKNRRWPVFLHVVISMLRSLMISGFSTFIPLYMHSRGHSLFAAGATTTVFQAVGAIGALWSGHIAARVDRRRTIMTTLLVAAPALVGFLYLPNWLALLSLAASGILLYFSFPLNIVMAQELYPDRAGMVSALMIGVSWGTAGLMMTPLGFIAESAGLESALLALAAAGVIAGCISWFLPKKS
jgi:FSR family fosmidomycin resistance protein-like MFS transporter